MLIAVFRTLVLYLLLIAGVRLMGKRQVGELEPSELVLDLLVADLASVPMQDLSLPLWAGVIPILTLLAAAWALSLLSVRSIRFRSFLWGQPSVLIANGILQQQEIRRNRLTVDELLEELRMKGFTDPSLVKYAVLETNGQLSILPYADRQPPTARDQGISVEEGGLPLILISDGRVVDRNLRLRGYDRAWLERQLTERGIQTTQQVYLLTVDELGRVYCAEKR